MSLTLLFSQRYTNDNPSVFATDINTSESLVFEVVDVNPGIRRTAGWLYSSVDSGLGDREISEMRRILFGKNRVQFTVHRPPFRLKFYPIKGLFNFDVNVYSGAQLPPFGTQLNTTFVGRLNKGIRHGVIEYRLTNSSSWTILPGVGAISEAYYRPGTNALIVRTLMNEITFCIVGTWTWAASDLATLRTVAAETATRALVTA